MTKRILFICFTVIIFISGVVYTQENNGLTLDDCYKLAAKKSYDLHIQAENENQAKERLTQAKGGMYPFVSYDYIRADQQSDYGLYSGDYYDSKLSVSQPLYSGGRKRSLIDFSKTVIEQAEFQYKSVDRNVSEAVVSSFYSIVEFNHDIANIDTTEKLLRDRKKELEERVRLGKSRDSEVLVVDSQISSLLAQREQALGSRAGALETLSSLTGLDSSQINLLDNTAGIDEISAIDKYIASAGNRSDILSAQKNVLAEQYQINITRGALLPTLNLNGYLYSNHGSMPGSNWTTLVSLDVPLYQGGAARSRVREEESKLKVFKEEQAQVTNDVMTEVKKFYQAASSSIKQYYANKDAYDKSYKSYEMQLRDYRYGLVTNLDVIESMTTMLSVKTNLDRSMIEAKLNKTLLDIAAK